MLIVGLTGGIGSGKSSVSNLFSELGVTVIDMDQIARDIVEIGSPVLKAIEQRFGKDILTVDGSLDRSKLRQIVFQNKAEKNWLEALLHPLIQEEKEAGINQISDSYLIVESPLLIERGQMDQFDRVLVVDTDKKTQLVRAMQRDGSSKDIIESIMASQATREQRLACADDIIENTCSIAALNDQVRHLHQQYLLLSDKNS